MNYFLSVFLLAGLAFSQAKAACPGFNASFTAAQTLVCGPGPTNIALTNTSTGAGAGAMDYDWYLNGSLFSSTSGLAAPAPASVNATGTYTVQLIASDNGNNCSDTATITIAVVPVPNASFNINSNNQCAGTNVSFSNTSTGVYAGTTYTWNFGDGSTATGNNANHVYGSGGTYNVTLTMNNGAGCASTITQQVTAQAIPNISIAGDDGDGNTTNCLLPIDTMTQETVAFSNATTGAVSYTWNFGDGSPLFTTTSNATFNHQYTTYGTFNVTMTATHANGCTATATLLVVFEKYVSTSFSVPITQMSGCAPHTVLPVNGSVNANTYVWNFGDGTPNITTTNFAAPSHVYTTNGSYTITLTASNSCNTAISTVSPIVIVARPNAQFTTSLPGNIGCAPQGVSWTNSSQYVAPANNYQWNFGNGNTASNVANPGGQVYSQGVYTIQMIAGNGCGTDTAFQTITIDTIPTAIISVNPVEGCTPLTVNTVNSSLGQSLSYAWYIDGVLTYTSQNIPPQTFTAPPGNNAVTHTIRLVVSNHCGSDDTLVPVIVHPAVQTTITPANPVICEGDSVSFSHTTLGDSLSWTWDFGNGITSVSSGPGYISYPAAGIYTVELIANGYCGTDTAYTTVTVNPIPVADFTVSPDSICAGESVTINNLSTPGSTATWNFGSGATPANSTAFSPPSISYSSPGTSYINLQVTLAGCSATALDSVIVHPVPVTQFTLSPAQGCSPLSVTVNNTSLTPNGETFHWDFGNGSTDNTANPPTQVFTTGTSDTTYNVLLVLTNTFGCADSLTLPVIVRANPVADFTPLTDTVCATYNNTFTNLSSGATSYQWNFGDGSPVSTAVNPGHAFATPGTYTIQLVASNNFGCTDTAYGTILVDSIPFSSFSASTECVGDSTIFSDSSSGAVSWDWNFGDGTTSSLQSPAHVYAAAGTYSVQLTVVNLAGCAHSSNQNITVNTVPVAAFTNTSTCIGQPTGFTSINTGAPSGWEWDFGDGTGVSTAVNPFYTYTDTGNYTVTLIVTAGTGCADTISQNVFVSPKPAAGFVFAEACTNDSIFFISTSSGGGDTYTWLFGDGNSNNLNDTDVAHVYTNPGIWQVSLIAGYAASGCADTVTLAVESYPRTAPAFSVNTPCLGQDVNFTDLTSGSPDSWTWNFGDGSSDTQQNPQHNYAAAGTYNVTLISSNTFGCVDSTIQPVTIYPLPQADFIADTVCENAISSFTDLSLSAVSWVWDFGDGTGTSMLASPQYTFGASGTYPVSLVVTNSDGCTDTATVNIIVNPNPVASFMADTACYQFATTFTETSTGETGWTWDFGDGSLPDFSPNPQHTYAADGSYSVSLITVNQFGCTDTSLATVVVLPRPQAGFTYNVVCAKESVQLSDTSTGSPSTWSWDFGDGSPLNSAQHPAHTYLSGGIYNVTFIAGNPSGCYDTLLTQVAVNTVPDPAFTATTVCQGNPTDFTDQSIDTDVIVNWAWDFGDGNNSFVQNPSYIYLSAGTYNVNLIVTNSEGCDSTVTIPVTVNPQPIAGFFTDTVCVGSPTTFTDTTFGTVNSWNWDFGDGNSSATGPVTSHTYASAGTYITLLSVSGGANCSDQTFAMVTVSNVVQAGIQAPDSVCADEAVNFVDASQINSGSINGWNWNFGDGTSSTSQNPAHVYTASGTYTIILQVTSSGGCVSTDSLTIVVSPKPNVDFSVANVCQFQDATFTDLSAPAAQSWNWNFGDGNQSANSSPVHAYSNPGVFNVQLTVTTPQGCSDSLSKPVLIYPKPTADFFTDTVCWGDTTTFVNTSVAGTGSMINTWLWNFGDGTSASGQHQQHVFQVYNDSFLVSMEVITNMGCRDTISRIVETLPVANMNFGPLTTSGCAPFTVTFSDSTTVPGGQIVNWLWDFGDGDFGFGQTTNHVYAEEGQYYASIEVTASTGCVFRSSLQYPVVVYPKPVAEFYYEPNDISVFLPNVQFYDLSQGANYWYWSFGDANFSSEQSPFHSYADSGTYTVELMVLNQYGCSDTVLHPLKVSGEYTMFFPSAFSPNGDGQNDFYNGQGTGIAEYKLMIFDRWGLKIFETNTTSQGWDGTIKGNAAPVDVYIWRSVVKDVFGVTHEMEGHLTLVR